MSETNLFAGVEFPETMDLRLAAVYANVSESRMRNLLREETIPSVKDDGGKYVIQKSDLAAWVAGSTKRTSKTGAVKGEGKPFIIKVPFPKLQAVKEALAGLGIELQPRYDYAKQKAYQAKRKAEGKAPAKKSKKAAPATEIVA
jgi:excisionase family DNA binding protein